MATFQKFEDIDVWQRARLVCKAVYRESRLGQFRQDRGLADQVQRAAVSVMANVAEGAGRGGNREFVQFLVIARGSAAEVRSHLYVAMDAGYITTEIFSEIMGETRQIELMIGGLVKRIRNTPHNGARSLPSTAA